MVNQARRHPETPEEAARQLQIIIGALIFGLVAFGSFVLSSGGLGKPPEPPFIALIGAGFAVLNFLLHIAVPAVLIRFGVKATQGDSPKLLSLYVGQSIVAAALLEGAAFLNLLALMSEHHWWSLAIVGLLVVALVILIPSSVQIGHWLEAKQNEVR